MTGTSGSGRFQSGSPTYTKLAAGFSTYCSTKYGYLTAQAYNDLTSGPPLICGALAASLWMSNGSNLSDTTYLPVAMWAITHVEELFAGSFGCDQTTSYCGLTSESPMDFTRLDLGQVAYTYTILKGGGALSSAQIQLFADKILNSNSTANNGMGGSHTSLTSSCVNEGMTTGTGTVSVSGTGIIFSSSVLDSTWVGAALYTDPINASIGRIQSVTNGTTAVLSRSEPSQTSAPYRYSKVWVQDTGGGIGNCGALWWNWHDVDAIKWYPGTEQQWPTNYPPDGGNYENLAVTFPNPPDFWAMAAVVNNKTFTQVDGDLDIAVALADDDVRAANLLQSVYNWYWKNSLPPMFSSFTPMNMAATQYSGERDLWQTVDIANVLCSSFYETGSGTPCALVSGMVGLKDVPSYYTYFVRTSDATTTQNPNGTIIDSWGGNGYAQQDQSWDTRAICEAGYLYPTLQDSKYMTYVDRNIFSYNSTGAHALNWAWSDYTYCDPAQTQTNISGAPKQFLYQDTDYATCTGNSTWVANGNCFANRSMTYLASRTGWALSDTLLTASGGYRYLGMDHGNFMDWGHYQISKNNATLLYYDIPEPDAFIHGWAANTIALGGDNCWGTVDNTGEGGIMGWAHVDRWAGNDPYGDPNSNYTYALINMNPGGTSGVYTNISAYNSSAHASRVQRHIIHFKKATYQDYVVAYDDVTVSTGESIHAYQQFFLATPSTYSTVTITPSSGGTNYGSVVNTNTAQTAMLNSAYRPVAGSNTLALVVDNANGSYSGGAGYTARAYMCPSTDGTTCANSTSYEGIAIHMPIAATSGSMPALTQPTCSGTGGNCTAVQIADSSFPKVAVFARQGALLTGASFTTTHSGTAQYVIAGLTPGTYNVTVGGSTVVSGATVNANDNTLYFESTDGAVVVSESGTPSYTLNVTTSGTGAGLMAGTNCVLGATSYASGTSYSCIAEPTAGTFSSWTGSTCGGTGVGNVYSGTLTGNCTINAVFNLAPTSALGVMQGLGIFQGTGGIK